MADSDKTLELLIKLGVVGKDDVQAANDLLKQTNERAIQDARDLAREMGVLEVSQKDIEAATRKTSSAVDESTGKFGESRREIREVGTELGRVAGISHLGGLFLGGVAAAAFAAGKALEVLKSTWEGIQESIKGPISIGLPEDAAGKISAAATAWNTYAEARAKAIASGTSAESAASADEKKLSNELKLIQEVLKAEEDKALKELELQKKTMSPEAYAAAEEQVRNVFGEAGKSAEAQNRQALIANKANEAFYLEVDARQKTRAAMGIKAAPENTREANEKALDANAAAAENAIPIIRSQMEMVARQRGAANGNTPAEYQGSYGKIQQATEGWEIYRNYAGMSFDEIQKELQQREAQAKAQIDAAAAYKSRETAADAERKRLMGEAGTESGNAALLRGEVKTDSAAAAKQQGVDDFVSGLHRQTAQEVGSAARETTAAVHKLGAATIAGFRDIHQAIEQQARDIANQAGQIKSSGNHWTG